MPYIEMKNVFFKYPNGFEALQDLSLDIDKGEKVAIIGQNGAGKTTMVKLINGLLKPTEGDIRINGKNTREYTTAKIAHWVSYVFQNPDDQIFHNDVISEISFGPKNFKMDDDKIEQNVKAAAELCGIEKFLEENPYDLPLATRKFITIASIIAMDTDVIILDEPTAGQDKKGIECLAQVIDHLRGKGKTVITITHDMEFVVNNFDRTVVMAQKQKAADGPTREIFWQEDVLQKARLKQPYISSLSLKLGLGGNNLTIGDFIAGLEQRRHS
ncbi:MAG: ABC transporter ATP-binding protein [Clostridia bacterium]|nr:ABC transporter ATP-binding protein [Clostridia bacterium]MDR3645797.1 ABC transporter ATP-binding protein [Clostridia bacterium]